MKCKCKRFRYSIFSLLLSVGLFKNYIKDLINHSKIVCMFVSIFTVLYKQMAMMSADETGERARNYLRLRLDVSRWLFK